MRIGKRTQAYFIGFLIGVAMVSILIDSRRNRFAEPPPPNTWERINAELTDLPPEATDGKELNPYITAVEELDPAGIPTGQRGYFFADIQGKRYWWFGSEGAYQLYTAEQFEVTSRPGIPAETMKDGFEYQGHEVLSDLATAPIYIVKVDAASASALIDAYQNLLSKQVYIASVDWVPVGEE